MLEEDWPFDASGIESVGEHKVWIQVVHGITASNWGAYCEICRWGGGDSKHRESAEKAARRHIEGKLEDGVEGNEVRGSL